MVNNLGRLLQMVKHLIKFGARLAGLTLLGALASFPLSNSAQAEKIDNAVAQFSGLDKITGRITRFDVYMGETVQFGALQVTPRVCYSRPRTEKAQSTAFIEVDELKRDKRVERIFTGWMFASNPGVHAVEHPVYDIWLEDCVGYSDVPPPENYSGPPLRHDGQADRLAGDHFVSSGVVGLPISKPK
nr:DUF2155 domain-containing protein [Pseudovibrio stylochi]